MAVLRELLFVLLAIVGPGLGLQRWARVRPDAAAVVPLGLLACASSYWASLLSGSAAVFPLLVGLACLPLLFWGPPRAFAEGPSLRGALPAFLTIVSLLALTQYRTNRIDADGRFLLDVGEHVDTAVHVGVSFELVAGYPPQVPGLAGVPMRYHVGSHLVRAAAVRWAGIHPYDAMNRFDVTLWALALVLALRASAAALGLGAGALRLAGFLPLLADLSYVPGLMTGSSFWAFKLGANFVEPLFHANSIAPAMAIALGALVTLARGLRGEGRGFVLIAAALAGGAGFLKVFTGAELLLALGLAYAFDRSRRGVLPLALALGVALALLVVGSLAPSGVEGVRAELVAFAPANPARLALGLTQARGLALFGSGLAWLVLAVGVSALGVSRAWRALRHGDGPQAALGALALCGWPIALCLRITADPAYDESFYFVQASGLALWLFASPVIAALALRSRLVAALLVALALPATVEFVARKAVQAPEPIDAGTVRAMAALRAGSCPGDVVLTRPGVRFVPPVVVLAGRRVALARFIPYWRQFTTPELVDAREAELRAFFQADDAVAALAAARRLGARFVYHPGVVHERWARFEREGLLAPVMADREAGVFRIVPLAPSVTCR